MTKRIFSGIKPSGRPHLGNYLGAMQHHVALSNDKGYESFFCVVDYHALTTIHDGKKLREYTQGIILDFLALGLNHEQAVLFIQSDVPAHAELSWILTNYVSVARVARVPTFKEKKLEQPEDVNFGLMSYAVLMAADILLYSADLVPVGIDQVPHVEIARDIAKAFNALHGETFVIPESLLHKESEKILGTDGVKKMSKSVGNTIDLFVDEKTTLEQVMSMVTDPKKARKNDPGRPEICNVFSFQKLFSTKNQSDQIATDCRSGLLGCVADKQDLASKINNTLAPFRERRKELEKNTKLVTSILEDGKKRASAEANTMMKKVRMAVGLD